MSPERETIYHGLSHAAWGYFFLHIHLQVNGIDILPAFVGWLLLLSACRSLSGERRDLALLRPLGVLRAGWSGLDWLLSWGGGGVGGHVLFLDLVVAAAGLYFHFQFLTDMAALAGQYQPEGSDLARRLCRRRTVYILLDTAIALTRGLPAGQSGPLGEFQTALAVGGSLIAIAAALLIITGLFGLRRCFREAGDPA